MKPVPAALSLSELWTLKALPAGVLDPIKNVLSSTALGINGFFFLSRFCKAREVTPELEGTSRRNPEDAGSHLYSFPRALNKQTNKTKPKKPKQREKKKNTCPSKPISKWTDYF